jgi:hypothetical protein
MGFPRTGNDDPNSLELDAILWSLSRLSRLSTRWSGPIICGSAMRHNCCSGAVAAEPFDDLVNGHGRTWQRGAVMGSPVSATPGNVSWCHAVQRIRQDDDDECAEPSMSTSRVL